MKVIAHRGYWRKKHEQNSLLAFQKALDLGVGVELDIWLNNGICVISHDPPTPSSPHIEVALDMLCQHHNFYNVQFAINIKSDGLEETIEKFVASYGIRDNSFVFDMSAPSTYKFLKTTGVKVAARVSEHEMVVFESLIHGIWLDAWESDWYNTDLITRWLDDGKFVAIVSPELHHRSREYFWSLFLEKDLVSRSNLYICTDEPEEALKLIGGG
jgi:hypothetical protein